MSEATTMKSTTRHVMFVSGEPEKGQELPIANILYTFIMSMHDFRKARPR